MFTVWRIVNKAYQSKAFDGEGAYRFGGRWNRKGIRMVYTSATLSLAALELLVHINPAIKFELVRFKLEFDENLIEKTSLQTLPKNWRAHPPSTATQDFGSRWVKENRSPVLAVPSAIIPEELNYLLNPLHPDFMKIRIGKSVDFTFDSRMI
ncbi:MAG: RES family NAD+ phosphorylase [Sumerlaeia bacterium]